VAVDRRRDHDPIIKGDGKLEPDSTSKSDEMESGQMDSAIAFRGKKFKKKLLKKVKKTKKK